MSVASGKNFRLRNPWYESWRCAWRRCTDEKHKSFYRYGGRGIKFLLTRGEVKFLWDRDQAHLMERPRLDRKDNDKDYCLENCRFIPESVNLARKYDNEDAPAEWEE